MIAGAARTDRARVVLLTDDGRPVDHWAGEVAPATALDLTPGAEAGPGGLDPDDLVVLCPPGVELFDDAEAAIAEMLVHRPDIDLAYADGVRAGTDGEGDETCLRPGFSPDRLRDQHYLGPLLLVRWRVVLDHRAAGDGLDLQPSRDELDRLTSRCRVIAHLPQILTRSARRAEPATTRPVPDRRPLRPRSRPLVSIVLPTMGATRRLEERSVTLCLQAIESVLERTDYQPLEIVPVLTPGTPERLPATIAALIDRQPVERRPRLTIRLDGRPFNFSNACNHGAVAARGDVLVFLNDDTSVVTGDWLDRLVTLATDPEIGAVGARLLHGDGTIQHAGIWSRGGHPAHRYQGFRADHPGHLGSLTVAQNCLAVTGACLAVETTKFVRAGGFSPEFPSSYNDVDLCLKLDALGHRTVVDPGAVLHHYEASTRDPVIEDWEVELLHRRWRRALIADPNDNPNHLAPGAEEFPPPDPTVAVGRQRTGRYRHPARIWIRSGPVADLTDLERKPVPRHDGTDPAADKERHVV